MVRRFRHQGIDWEVTSFGIGIGVGTGDHIPDATDFPVDFRRADDPEAEPIKGQVHHSDLNDVPDAALVRELERQLIRIKEETPDTLGDQL